MSGGRQKRQSPLAYRFRLIVPAPACPEEDLRPDDAELCGLESVSDGLQHHVGIEWFTKNWTRCFVFWDIRVASDIDNFDSTVSETRHPRKREAVNARYHDVGDKQVDITSIFEDRKRIAVILGLRDVIACIAQEI